MSSFNPHVDHELRIQKSNNNERKLISNNMAPYRTYIVQLYAVTQLSQFTCRSVFNQKMLFKQLLRIFIIFQLISCACLENIANANDPYSVKVLANEFPPFTYFNSSHGFYDGIDILILKTIAERLNFKLIFTKTNASSRIQLENLE